MEIYTAADPLNALDIPGIAERKYPRFFVDLPCLYSKENGQEVNGTINNLSKGGCAVHSSTPVLKGDYIRLRIFPSSNHPPIEISLAPVRWVRDEQFGVEFITLTPRDSRRLDGYLMFIHGQQNS